MVAEVLHGEEFCPRDCGNTELREVDRDRVPLLEEEFDLRGSVELCEGERCRREERGVELLV